jgi:hypothetical protein
MLSLIRKNLIAHKEKNKLTALIYSLTLAAVVFLMVPSSLMFQQQVYHIVGEEYGAQIKIDFYGKMNIRRDSESYFDRSDGLPLADLTDILTSNPNVKDWTWMTDYFF